MAKNYSQLLGVMDILKEVLKLPLKNKKMFLFVILSTMIPYSLLVLANIFSLVSLSKNLAMKAYPLLSMDPRNPEYLQQVSRIKEETSLLILAELIFLLLMAVTSLFSMVATIYVSAMSYLGRDLTVVDISLKIKHIWIRPVITWFYFSLLNAGYIVFILPLCFVVVLERGSFVVSTIGIALLLLAVVLHIYLALVWMLSLVTSVLEDCFGLQALGKAEKLVKGRKVVGLVLTFLLIILFGAIFLVSRINNSHQTGGIRFVVMYVALNVGILVKIMSMMVYTVFYFERKQSHGEQVEVEEDMGYSRVSTNPLVGSALP